MASEAAKLKLLRQFSNPATVRRRAASYLGRNAKIKVSSRRDKKYQVVAPGGRTVHFGQMGYEDFTKHKDPARRRSYLARSAGIGGTWARDRYSANNLARRLLW